LGQKVKKGIGPKLQVVKKGNDPFIQARKKAPKMGFFFSKKMAKNVEKNSVL
jgi:hypothetical protein